MPLWSIRQGTETVVADDRESLARLVGAADAETAEEMSDDTAQGEPTTDDGSGNSTGTADGGSDGSDATAAN